MHTLERTFRTIKASGRHSKPKRSKILLTSLYLPKLISYRKPARCFSGCIKQLKENPDKRNSKQHHHICTKGYIYKEKELSKVYCSVTAMLNITTTRQKLWTLGIKRVDVES
jgi:hypothetical protein